MFIREFVVEDYVDRVQVGGAGVVAGQDAGSESALQWGEVEDRVTVAAEDELDEAVAESADSVVEEDGVGHGTLETLAGCEVKSPTPSASPLASLGASAKQGRLCVGAPPRAHLRV